MALLPDFFAAAMTARAQIVNDPIWAGLSATEKIYVIETVWELWLALQISDTPTQANHPGFLNDSVGYWDNWPLGSLFVEHMYEVSHKLSSRVLTLPPVVVGLMNPALLPRLVEYVPEFHRPRTGVWKEIPVLLIRAVRDKANVSSDVIWRDRTDNDRDEIVKAVLEIWRAWGVKVPGSYSAASGWEWTNLASAHSRLVASEFGSLDHDLPWYVRLLIPLIHELHPKTRATKLVG